MKTKTISPLLLVAIVLLQGCATTKEGADKLAVRSQQTTELAYNTFDFFETTDLQTYPAFKALAPEQAAKVRTYVNYIRANSPGWIATARELTKTYQASSTVENATALNKALAVLTTAIAQAQSYTAQMQEASMTMHWMSLNLRPLLKPTR